MTHALLQAISSFVLFIIAESGYAGIFFLMTLESAAIPIPSEIIMPFSGFLAARGDLNLVFVVIAGTAGNLFGSLLLYGVGMYGGRPLLKRYGKYFLFSEAHAETAESWFGRYGSFAAFFSRMLPVVRTYISFPAGVGRMNIWKFIIYTTAGSLIWSFALAEIGVILGERWQTIETYGRKFDIIIGILIVAGVIYFFWSHLKKRNNHHQ